MPERFVVYCDVPPSIWVEGGMVHLEFPSGGTNFHCVISIANALIGDRRFHSALEEFQGERAREVVRFRVETKPDPLPQSEDEEFSSEGTAKH